MIEGSYSHQFCPWIMGTDLLWGEIGDLELDIAEFYVYNSEQITEEVTEMILNIINGRFLK